MANTDKNIVITPNIGSANDPQIVFSGADASTAAQNITLKVYPNNNGTLSFEGSAGQLFSITNSFSGTIFSVNDVSGIPSIEVLDTGLVKIAQYGGNVLMGTGTDNGNKLQVNGGLTVSDRLQATKNDTYNWTSNGVWASGSALFTRSITGLESTNGWTIDMTSASQFRIGVGSVTSTPALKFQISSDGTVTFPGNDPVIILQDTNSTTAANHTGWVSYRDSGGTEQGWVGFGSTGNSTFSIVNNYANSDVNITAGNTDGYVNLNRLKTTVLTTGAAATAGSVTGTWTLTANSQWNTTLADLAEWYQSDQEYEHGTVLIVGGPEEVTISTTANDTRVAGVVSTAPGFVMSVDLPGPSACVALQGKVPVKVIGQVQKGDLLVSSDTPGYAMVNNAPAPYTVIGKALENKTTDGQGIVKAIVSR